MSGMENMAYPRAKSSDEKERLRKWENRWLEERAIFGESRKECRENGVEICVH